MIKPRHAILSVLLPLSVAVATAQQPLLPHAGPLDVQLRTDAGNDVHLRMETAYSTQEMGRQLTTEQIEKLDTIRAEAPDKYQILSALFPRQIAEFLLRTPSPAPNGPADDALQRLVWEIGCDYIRQPQGHGFTEGQLKARADFVRAALRELPPQPPAIQRLLEQAAQYEDGDFNSADKASTFLVLKQGYSPYRPVAKSIVGDELRIDGKVFTDHLSADADAVGRSPEEYANAVYARYTSMLQRWRSGQLTGNAYAGTIRRFLNDPRLAEFTPGEVSRAYERVFGRDLKTDLEADRIAARLGRPVTYNEMHAVH